MLVSASELVLRARKTGTAVAQFNVWNCTMLFGVIEALEQAHASAILATGSAFLPPRELTAFSKMLLEIAAESALPLAVHWDHAHRVDEVKTARELGFTSVMIDGSELPLAENIELTREAKRLLEGSNIALEGELGYIGRELGGGATEYCCTAPCDAERYVAATNADLLAVSIGNAHGAYRAEPKLDYATLEKLRETVPIPLVLHGGSGIPDEGIARAIRLGIRKINYHTELCEAASSVGQGKSYRIACAEQLRAVREKVLEKLRLVSLGQQQTLVNHDSK